MMKLTLAEILDDLDVLALLLGRLASNQAVLKAVASSPRTAKSLHAAEDLVAELRKRLREA